jgi:hypothetical protein
MLYFNLLLFLMSKEKNIDYDKFWNQREEEIGKPVLYKSIVRIENIDGPSKWALFYGSNTHCYFQFFETTNWYANLLNRGPSGENSCVEISYDKITSWVIEPEKTFLKIFRLNEGKIAITFTEEIEINSEYKTDHCVFVPMMSVSALQKQLPIADKTSIGE